MKEIDSQSELATEKRRISDTKVMQIHSHTEGHRVVIATVIDGIRVHMHAMFPTEEDHCLIFAKGPKFRNFMTRTHDFYPPQLYDNSFSTHGFCEETTWRGRSTQRLNTDMKGIAVYSDPYKVVSQRLSIVSFVLSINALNVK